MKAVILKIKIFSVLLLYCFANSLSSQTTFQNSYSLTDGRSIRTTYDDGYIVCGSTEVSSGAYNSHLTKLDCKGDIEWVKIYGEPSTYHHYGYSVEQTRDSGFVMTGVYRAYGQTALTKTDKLGNIQWFKIFASNRGMKVKQTTDDGFVVTADNNTFIKTDNAGNLQWEASFTNLTFAEFEVHDVIQTMDGGYIAIGKSWKAGIGNYILVTKIDGSGNFLWAKTYELNLDERGYSILQLTTGEYILQGYHRNDATSSSDNFVIKIDGMGNPIWSKLYPLVNPYSGFQGFYNEIQPTQDNGFVFGHEFLKVGTSVFKTFLTKINSLGNVEWSNSYCDGYLHSLAIAPDNGIVFTGWNSGGAFVVKTDSLGLSCNYDPVVVSSIDVIFATTNISLFKTNSTFESSPSISTISPTIVTTSGCYNGSECLFQQVIPPLEPPNDLTIPNVFTPNGDNTNDFFKVEYSGLDSFEIKIYNRWGEEVFNTNDSNNYWNGKIHNSEAEVSDGTYFYVLQIGAKTYKGFLTILK